MNANKFRIKSGNGFYVAGFNRTHLCVVISQTAEGAKTFTQAAANKFIASYQDAGYGLTGGVIEPVATT